MSSRARRILNFITKDTIRKKETVTNSNNGNDILVKTMHVIEEPDRNQESPMPLFADMNVIDQMMSFLSDSDENDNNICQGHNKSDINKNIEVINIEANETNEGGQLCQLPESSLHNDNRSDENHTPIPSPECTTNHLDYDCENNFCPWYIENALQEPHSVISSTTDLLSTPQANTPFSSFSESVPSCSRKRKKISRKDIGNIRRRHVADWIENKRKKQRNLGKEYKSRDGTTRLAKSLKPMCSENCRQKCTSKITDDERLAIFNLFWNLGNREKQWAFVAYLVMKQNKRRVFTDTTSRRNFTLIYRLKVNRGNEEECVVVCKKTFLNTFSVSEQFIYTALEKLDVTSGLIEIDQRGRHNNHRKIITEDIVKSVCDHVKSIQPVESHLGRSRSSKIYLDGDLNFHRLFDLYKEWFDDQIYSSIATTERQYRDIVNEHFKLSFHIPKKDQCDKCHIYKNKSSPTLPETQLYESHLQSKELARNRKLLDKAEAKTSDGKIVTATFDFQKVLNAPHGNLSILYYKRKLSVFNFTVFNVSDKEGTCFMWHEGQGKREGNEVSSCLLKFISKHKDLGANEFRFWSDNAVGQNRNRIVYAMYMYAAATFQVSIRHCFLEVGHTQNEGDSVHALIERSAKNKLIYTPHEWYCLVRWAKQDGKPYIVEEMQYTDFSNFKLLLQGNWITSNNGDKVKWTKIKEVFVKPDDPNKLYYKYDIASNDYYVLSVKKSTRRQCSTDSSVSVEPLYQSNLSIPKAKKDDLVNLCKSLIIPSGYHDFFTNLPSANISDNIPEIDECDLA